MLNEWDKDLSEIESLIEQRQAAGEKTIYLEINLNKSNRRYDAIIENMGLAKQLFDAMQEEINKARQWRIRYNDLKAEIETLRPYRPRICDL